MPLPRYGHPPLQIQRRPRRAASPRLPLGPFRASTWSRCSDCAHMIGVGDPAYRHPGGVACGLRLLRYMYERGQQDAWGSCADDAGLDHPANPPSPITYADPASRPSTPLP